MKFQESDKVVVIKDPMLHWHNEVEVVGFVPKLGSICCILKSFAVASSERASLVGSTTKQRVGGQELGWVADCFRKVGGEPILGLIRPDKSGPIPTHSPTHQNVVKAKERPKAVILKS